MPPKTDNRTPYEKMMDATRDLREVLELYNASVPAQLMTDERVRAYIHQRDTLAMFWQQAVKAAIGELPPEPEDD